MYLLGRCTDVVPTGRSGGFEGGVGRKSSIRSNHGTLHITGRDLCQRNIALRPVIFGFMGVVMLCTGSSARRAVLPSAAEPSAASNGTPIMAIQLPSSMN
jgi:hypothetical protein